MISAVSTVKAAASASNGTASRQFSTTVAGSSTKMKTKAAKCSRKNDTHSHHSASVPASMTFTCRPECAPAW